MKNHHVVSSSILFLLVYFLKDVKCEFYTAIAELEKLLSSVDQIVKTLETYQKKEEERLSKVKWLKKQYENLQIAASRNAETFLSNPINAYLLIKRLSHDWEVTEHIAGNSGLLRDISAEKINIPTKEDLQGAASALLGLQSTFLLDTSSLARGEIKGTNSFTDLSAGDCLELGRQALQEFYSKYALHWLEESMDRFHKENGWKTANETDIMEYMAFAHYSMHNYSKAVEITEKILELDPDNARVWNNLFSYRTAKENNDAKQKDKDQQPDETIENKAWPQRYLTPDLVETYERLCRGESTKTAKEESRLYCYQTSNGNSYLILQPVKMEVLHLNPRIVLYYDVLKENEADVIKSVALPQLIRAQVVNGTSGTTNSAPYRISKNAWLLDSSHPVIAKLSRRVGDISGLDVEYAEALHAINYGIGGHYYPHIDFARLSHVPAGGSTVFPLLGVEVKPVKGAAAFWYNLYKNGTGNEDTIHAACPVLLGSKWVANKWLHEKGNEFRRPCSLNPIE